MQHIKSLIQKANTIIQSGSQPLMDGYHNYNNPNPDIEEIAGERLSICITCPHYQDEEIKMFQIDDKLLPMASNKKCNDCGCILSYKIRQLVIRCNKWKV